MEVQHRVTKQTNVNEWNCSEQWLVKKAELSWEKQISPSCVLHNKGNSEEAVKAFVTSSGKTESVGAHCALLLLLLLLCFETFCQDNFWVSLPTQGHSGLIPLKLQFMTGGTGRISRWTEMQCRWTVCARLSASVSLCVGLLLSSQDRRIVTLQPWISSVCGLPCFNAHRPVALSVEKIVLTTGWKGGHHFYL